MGFLFVPTCFLHHWILLGVNHLGPTVFWALIHLDSLTSLLFKPNGGRCYTTIFISYSPTHLNYILGYSLSTYFNAGLCKNPLQILRHSYVPVKVSASSVFSIPTSYFLHCHALYTLSQWFLLYMPYITHRDESPFHPLASSTTFPLFIMNFSFLIT